MATEKTVTQTSKRDVCWDILRIVCTLPMIFIHVSVYNYNVLEQGSSVWNVCNFYNGISRYCIPLLFMISGLFFLDSNREYPLKKLYGKKVSRLIVAYVFWAGVYSIIQSFAKVDEINVLFIKELVYNFVFARYHLWFLLALTAIYMIVPFLRVIAQNNELNKYFIILWCAFSIVAPILTWLPGILGKGMSFILDDANMYMVFGYSGFMLLGNYLKNKELNKKSRIIIYSATVVVTAISIYANRWAAGTHVDLYNYFAPSPVLVAVSIFVFIKTFTATHTISPKVEKIITTLGGMGFGVYLSHEMFIDLFMDVLGLSTMTMTVITIPAICILVLVTSFLFTYLVRKIPYGKWIA